jgi:hypothetical protein
LELSFETDRKVTEQGYGSRAASVVEACGGKTFGIVKILAEGFDHEEMKRPKFW